MVFEGAFFQGFAPSQAMLVQQLDDHGNADVKPPLRQFRRQTTQREVGPQGAGLHRVARRERADDVQERGIEIGEQAQAGFSAAPFFRDRPGGKEFCCCSSRMPRRMVFGSQSKRRVR